MNIKSFFILCVLIFLIVWPLLANANEEKPIETYRLDIEIDAPADFLYPYLIYEDKIIKWNNDTSVEVSFPKGIEPRIGKQIRISLKNVPTSPWMLLEIIKLDTNREVLTRFIDGVLEGEFAYLLKPLDGNRTRLIHEMRIRPVGALVTVVWEIHGKRVHRKKMWAFMQNMKTVVEKEWAAKKEKTEGKGDDEEK